MTFFHGRKRPKSLKAILISISIIYFICLLFGFKKLYQSNSSKVFKYSNDVSGSINEENQVREGFYTNEHYKVDIWGKAAIGFYLWNHILGGRLESEGPLMQIGRKKIRNITYTYRTGAGLVPSTSPKNVTHLVLVINGRSSNKVREAKIWLDSLPAYEKLLKVAVVLLGNERCENDWILPYMVSRGGIVDLCFLTYDCLLVDNMEFYQWPLGVATYRGFPNVKPEQLDVDSSRPYLCTFLGTIYKNSTREKVLQIVQSSERLQEDCLVVGRDKWQSQESNKSLQNYIDSLLKSDLALSPVGYNTECYRIFEALSMGSVPVVEDVVTPGSCDRVTLHSPLRLLKSYNAPLIYLKDWSQLPAILKQDSLLPYKKKVKRRTEIVLWYKNFKNSMSDKFTNIISQKFFKQKM